MRRPSYPFLILSSVLALVFVAAIIVIINLNTATNRGWDSELTATYPILVNATVAADATRTAAASTPRMTNIDAQATAVAIDQQTREAAAVSPTLSPSRTPTATSTSTTAAFTSCGWQWARQDLPDITQQAQARLAANFPKATVRVEAYGENCLNPNGSLRYFAAMTTDFYITLPVDNLSDTEAVAGQVVAVYTALTEPTMTNLPARYGYLDLTFTSSGETKRLRAMFDPIKGALAQGLSGAALLTELGGMK